MAVPIQLAIQGGGAKITYLIAALEALQELQNEGIFEVKRIAGTSAGAIAGALFAAGVDMKLAKATFELRKAELLAAFPSTESKAVAAYKLLTNQPFWDPAALRRVLKGLLEGKETLGDLNIPLVIVASDLTNMQPCIYERSDEPLVSCLMDSAAIPFFFRTVAKGTGAGRVIVDGGICENLPSEKIGYAPEYGEVIGITFAVSRAASNPTSFFAFARALLETAMNASVLRAQLELGLNNFVISTDAGTFDFTRAFNSGLQGEYVATKLQAEKFFRDYFGRHTRLAQELIEKAKAEEAAAAAEVTPRADFPESRLDAVISALRTMYQLQQEPIKFDFELIRVELTAWSQVAGRSNEPDDLRHEIIFRATEAPVSCYKIRLSSAEAAELQRTQCEVFDCNYNPIGFDLVPITHDPRDLREYLLFFRDPIAVDDPRSPVTIRVRDAVGAGLTLRVDRRDEVLTRASRADRVIRRVEMIVHLPDDLSDTVVAAAPGPEGRRMTPAELISYAPPAGFTTFGWKGEEIPSNTMFGCILMRP